MLMSFCALFIFEQPIFEEPRSSAESGPPRPLARASVALGAVAIPLRSWLHHWPDQEKARLYFGRAALVLEATRQAGAVPTVLLSAAMPLSETGCDCHSESQSAIVMLLRLARRKREIKKASLSYSA